MKFKHQFFKKLPFSTFMLLFSVLCVTEYGKCQQPIWANSFATVNSGGSILAVDADNNGNSVMVGSFTNTIDFDPGSGVANKTSVSSNSTFENAYIAKYDANGNFQWVNQIENRSVANAVDVDKNGNVYVVGQLMEGSGTSYDMDPGPGQAILTTTSGTVGFVVKYDSNGNYVWAFLLNGSISTPIEAIKVNNSELAIVGYDSGTVDFDPGGGVMNLTPKGKDNQRDVFFAKYDLNGSLIWAKDISNGYGAQCTGRALDMNSAGDIIVKGFYRDSIYFDPASVTPDLIVPPGENHLCLAKYNANGNLIWFGDIGTIPDPSGTSETVAMDDAGYVYLGGYITDTNDFDPGTGIQNFIPNGGTAAFVAKYDLSGNYLWAFKFGDAGGAQAYAIELDTCDHFYISGGIDGTADLDPMGKGHQVTVNNGYFVAKYSLDGNFVWAQHQDGGTTADDSWSTGLAVSSPQNIIVGLHYRGTPDIDKTAATLTLDPFISNIYFDLALAMLEPLPPDVPTILAPAAVCSGGPSTLTITAGELNSATDWYWYEGSCGGMFVGQGKSITVNPTSATTYFVRGEGKCIPPGSCGQVTITPGPPGAIADFSFTTNCSGEVTFQDESTGPVTIHTWDFGDMLGTSTNQNPTYTYSQADTYDVKLLVETADGCKDSITKTVLLFSDQTVFDTITICPSELPYSIHGIDRSMAGTYDNTITVNGCDSTSSVTLEVNDAIENEVTINGCDSIQVDGQWYTNDIELRDTIFGGSHTGCDSVIIQQIKITNAIENLLTFSGCNSVQVDGQFYTNDTTLRDTLFGGSFTGCDSIVIKQIQISNNIIENQLTFSGCDSVQIDGQWYTNNIELRDTVFGGSHTGCDSVVIKQIQISKSPNLIITADNDTVVLGNQTTLQVSGADSYLWDNGASTDQIVVTPNSNTTYCVTGTTAGSCNASLCISIAVEELVCEANTVFIPTGISPNNDGKNDELCVFGAECLRDEVVFEIYDRWGNQVFYSEDKNACWDGTYNGKELDNAVFIFRFNGELLNGELIQLAGNTTILK